MAWQGRLLRVDLTAGTCTEEALNMEWAQTYLGSRGLATKYLVEEMDPKADPLSPENILIFATGPLTGTTAPTAGRYTVVTKGALTNAIACSNSGGYFGGELKLAGWDMVLCQGRSPRPVYLYIKDDHAELIDAEGFIWGKSVWDTEPAIKARHQDGAIKIASIGRGGGEPEPLRVRDERPRPGRRALRRRRRDGVQEPESHRGSRHPGRRGGRRRGLRRRRGAGRRRARREPDPRRPRAHRHALHDRRDPGLRQPADPQQPGRAVRGHRQPGPRRDGEGAPLRRCRQSGRQSRLLRLHHRLPARVEDGAQPFRDQGPGSLQEGERRAGVRVCLFARPHGGRGRHRGRDLRQLRLQRGRDGPDLLRGDRCRRHGALRGGAPSPTPRPAASPTTSARPRRSAVRRRTPAQAPASARTWG